MKFTVDVDVPVPMSDGTLLMTNIWRPEAAHPVPVLLHRGPYGKDNSEFCSKPNVFQFIDAGYALALQDARGAGRSEGVLVPCSNEGADGADTIAWLARQDWCDGSVGMFGGSYNGLTQWLAAGENPPALKAIAPMVTTADPYRAPWFSHGGAFSLECSMNWATTMAMAEYARQAETGTPDPADLQTLFALLGSDELYRTTPLAEQPLLEKYCPWIADFFAHPSRDEYWQYAPVDHPGDLETPALTVTGWYDLFLDQSLVAYQAAQEHGGPGARGNQSLVIGPWSHGPTGLTGLFPERRFGLTAYLGSQPFATMHTAFFDRWLKGDEHALDTQSPVRIFVMGTDQWRDEQAWPLPDTAYTDYHLDSAGLANTADGDGQLTTTSPTHNATDRYLYDPRRPVPTLGGHVLGLTDYNGPADQSPVELRHDVLIFSTEPVDHPIEVTGPVTAVLHVSSSAVDTDFTAKLVDVFPDGRAILLCEGMQRMRYRNSLEASEFMTPGQVYEITIEMAATSNVFRPGHRIRLEISSSNFPRYDRNTNTGGEIFREHDDEMITAVNQLHHGPDHSTRLVLPIIDRRSEVR